MRRHDETTCVARIISRRASKQQLESKCDRALAFAAPSISNSRQERWHSPRAQSVGGLRASNSRRNGRAHRVRSRAAIGASQERWRGRHCVATGHAGR